KFCCQPHALRHTQESRRKLQIDTATLRRLYLDERRTQVQIGRIYGVGHHVIGLLLRQRGITTRRGGGWGATHCIVDGCSAPIYKAKHTSGYRFGRRCLEHWQEHRRSFWHKKKLKRRVRIWTSALGPENPPGWKGHAVAPSQRPPARCCAVS